MGSEAGVPTGTPLDILVVEDHHDTANLLSRLLASYGHRVRTAETFSDAQILCDRAPGFDVIFCDIGLPDGDGNDLPRLVRAVCPDTRMIAVTGYAMPADLAAITSAGFDGHVVKPFEVAALLGHLQGLRGRIKMSAAPEALSQDRGNTLAADPPA
jgi:CheY-like chemotaxis protein